MEAMWLFTHIHKKEKRKTFSDYYVVKRQIFAWHWVYTNNNNNKKLWSIHAPSVNFFIIHNMCIHIFYYHHHRLLLLLSQFYSSTHYSCDKIGKNWMEFIMCYIHSFNIWSLKNFIPLLLLLLLVLHKSLHTIWTSTCQKIYKEDEKFHLAQ
jgi:hypothetical protein